MLTNPLYVGRSRHKTLVHDGLYPAIIASDRWDEVQTRLAADAARGRGWGSPFIGKVFDETGDRLTRSHASRKGVRHRCHVSHRPVRRSGVPGPAGRRPPARPLERAVAGAVPATLREPSFPSRLIEDASAAEVSSARLSLPNLAGAPTADAAESAVGVPPVDPR